MPVIRNVLGIKVYTPVHVGDDARLVGAVHGLEQALSGMRLDWTVSEDKKLIHLPQRDEWFAHARRTRSLPFVCNNDESYPVTMAALEIPATYGPGGQPMLDIHADLPLEPAVIAAAAEMLEAIAEGAQALWGQATPFAAALDIVRQASRTLEGVPSPPRGLPPLKQGKDIRSPEIPHRLGWLNYWSANAARAIGFPEPARDADLLSQSRRTATGGWVVRLTDAPLELDNPAHLAALLRAYERFPKIGGRAAH
ncbi:DUF5953 family protein [Stigmatella hybrida]|uniref:DUF5953 family protein n=1 Tax=Stigmatella hybrida TaxID=394097 RepID=UPI001CDB02A6|nr:DUF5953 family protein [Stigmatella hybrida]